MIRPDLFLGLVLSGLAAVLLPRAVSGPQGREGQPAMRAAWAFPANVRVAHRPIAAGVHQNAVKVTHPDDASQPTSLPRKAFDNPSGPLALALSEDSQTKRGSRGLPGGRAGTPGREVTPTLCTAGHARNPRQFPSAPTLQDLSVLLRI
jgi:hypothetical protein